MQTRDASEEQGGRDALRPPLDVLLVEDSPYLALRVRELLEQADRPMRITTVDSEAEAIAALAGARPRVVILDLHLRSGSGFGVLAAMVGMPGPRPLVVVLTNYATPLYERAARSFGVPHFLDKARDFERIPQIVQAVD